MAVAATADPAGSPVAQSALQMQRLRLLKPRPPQRRWCAIWEAAEAPPGAAV